MTAIDDLDDRPGPVRLMAGEEVAVLAQPGDRQVEQPGIGGDRSGGVQRQPLKVRGGAGGSAAEQPAQASPSRDRVSRARLRIGLLQAMENGPLGVIHGAGERFGVASIQGLVQEFAHKPSNPST